MFLDVFQYLTKIYINKLSLYLIIIKIYINFYKKKKTSNEVYFGAEDEFGADT